jgi:HK97 family phage major capsid protein
MARRRARRLHCQPTTPALGHHGGLLFAQSTAKDTTMNKHLQALLARRQAAVARMKAIGDAAAARAEGNLTAEERTEFDAVAASIAELDGDITRARAVIEATRAGAGAVDIGTGRIDTEDNAAADPTHGFRSFGEFAQAVRAASQPGVSLDRRLAIGAAAPSNFMNEGSGADGGFLVPPQFGRDIVTAAFDATEALLPMTDNIPLGDTNSMTFPVDETTPWGGGIQAYWTGESAASTQSKGSLQPAQMRLSKLTALVPITEELAADAPALGAYVSAKTPEAIMWKTNEALWNGDGIGKPRGVFKAGALVTVTKETSQTAATIVLANITKMRARMPAMSYRRAIWMINNDCLPQLDALAYGTALANKPIYDPVGGQFGYGTLLGRPVMVTQHNETVGTTGDIACIDWMKYRTITKAAGVEVATSMHFWFDQGVQAYRAVFRIDGQPVITKVVTPNKGSATLSPFVVLETRA